MTGENRAKIEEENSELGCGLRFLNAALVDNERLTFAFTAPEGRCPLEDIAAELDLAVERIASLVQETRLQKGCVEPM